MRTWRFDLDSDVHTARLARHALRSWLDVVGCSADTTLDAVLLASELVAEGVADDAERVSLRASFDHGRLRLEVRLDHPAGVPSDGGTSIASCGTRVAAAVADDWGRSGEDGAGTVTWAEMLC